MKENKRLIDANEAAVITGLRPETIRKLASHGRIRSYKVLGALRFRTEDLQQLITERPAQPQGSDQSGKRSEE